MSTDSENVQATKIADITTSAEAPAPVSIPALTPTPTAPAATPAATAKEATTTAPPPEPAHAVPTPPSAAPAATPTPAPAPTAAAVAAVPASVEKPTATTTAPAPTPAVEAKAEAKGALNATSPAPEPAKTTVMAEPPEPQNPLTKLFSEKEWKALVEFRSTLPVVLSEAYPDDSSASTKPFEIWGVTIDPNGQSKDAKASVILMKFLRARNLSVRSASEMLANTLKWRKQIDIPTIMKEEFPPQIFAGLGTVFGKDKQGRPVTYNIYGGNQDLASVFSDTPRFIRWRISLMEKGMKEIDFETVDQMVQIHDYDGVGLSSRTPESKAAATEATNIFQSHYPEMLYRKYFINVPTFMTWVFWAFKPLMSAATLAKMSVVGRGARTIGRELGQTIDLDSLPERYGGKATGF